MNKVKKLYANRKLIFKLARNDFKTRFAGSYLGIFWAFVQPVVTVLVYWFVFQVGLKSTPVGDYPFVLWLVAGLVPWFFFSDALSAGTSAMLEYQYLVKKVVFEISILPIVKVLSAMIVHVFFMLLAVLLCAINGFYPDLYTLQIIYYSFATFVMVVAIVYFTCAVVVFFRDTSQIIGIFLQVGIWMTPIMWQVSILPKKFLWIFKCIPMYYIVQGYRDALLDKHWVWERPVMTLYFWVVTLVMLWFGTKVFSRLKVHFADVL
jgi:teichoic acid transport system permease protein